MLKPCKLRDLCLSIDTLGTTPELTQRCSTYEAHIVYIILDHRYMNSWNFFVCLTFKLPAMNSFMANRPPPVDSLESDGTNYDDMKEVQNGEGAQIYGDVEMAQKYGYVSRG